MPQPPKHIAPTSKPAAAPPPARKPPPKPPQPIPQTGTCISGKPCEAVYDCHCNNCKEYAKARRERIAATDDDVDDISTSSATADRLLLEERQAWAAENVVRPAIDKMVAAGALPQPTEPPQIMFQGAAWGGDAGEPALDYPRLLRDLKRANLKVEEMPDDVAEALLSLHQNYLSQVAARKVDTPQPKIRILKPGETTSDGVRVGGLPAVPQPWTDFVRAETAAAGKPAFSGTPPHVVVVARAGTGKTTTLVGGLQAMKGQQPTDAKGKPITPSEQQAAVWEQMALSTNRCRFVCFAAFNYSIAQELKRRVPPGVDAKTINGLGFGAVHKAFKLKPDRQAVNEHRVDDIIEELTGVALQVLRQAKPVVLKAARELVGKCKMNLVHPWDFPQKPPQGDDGYDDEGDYYGNPFDRELQRLADYYEVDLRDEDGVDHRVEVFKLVPRVLERCKDVQRDGCVDFQDQIWLPVVLGLPVFQYDVLCVDEAQDLNRCQHALVRRAGRRLILCGDPRQAIYGFAGADANSMDRLGTDLKWTKEGCVTLPLTVTRRCGRAIVTEANRIVPDFEAHESNGEGAVTRAQYPFYLDNGERQERAFDKTYLARCKPGDMVVCRVNAPLVSNCFAFLRRGVPANIIGRNVGTGLINLIKSLDCETVPALVARVEGWARAEIAKEMARRNPNEARIINISDRAECVLHFTEGTEEIQVVLDRIDDMFTDKEDRDMVRLSSIHKAKGLEADTVFFLTPPGAECPHPLAKSAWQREQEMNLRYVAITRAAKELVYVV